MHDEPTKSDTLERLLSRIEHEERLDEPAGKLAQAIGERLGGEAARNLLGGRWLGHPAHPALIVVPLGAWTSALVLDLISPRRSARAARALTGVGVVSAVPVAMTGAHDWMDTAGAERRVGLVHAAANGVALVFFTMSWWHRRRGRRLLGMVNGWLGALASGAGGFLGGHLVYRRGVGVTPTAFEAGPTEWSQVARSEEVRDGQPHLVRAEGAALVLVRREGRLHCLENRCAHRGGPLHEGRLRNGAIECPWHSSVFRLSDGAVLAGPSAIPQPAYEVREEEGVVSVRRPEPGSLRTQPQVAERD
jgi:nitrite reductase/ring-hydroxylating ferredoxin subunit/uncharacterized membrane protein